MYRFKLRIHPLLLAVHQNGIVVLLTVYLPCAICAGYSVSNCIIMPRP